MNLSRSDHRSGLRRIDSIPGAITMPRRPSRATRRWGRRLFFFNTVRPQGFFGMESSPFADLIARLRKGDAAAADQFMGEYGEAIHREVRFTLLGDRLRQILSESNVCQSVMMRFFVELWAGKYDFEDPAHLIALLKTMVRSRVVDLQRHWMAQRRDIRRTWRCPAQSAPAHARNGNTPSQIAANAEVLAEVKHRLSAHEWRILELRQQGLTWPETADRVGSPGGAEGVRKQYERALARVTKEIGLEDESS